jgi:hypothetical protein
VAHSISHCRARIDQATKARATRQASMTVAAPPLQSCLGGRAGRRKASFSRSELFGIRSEMAEESPVSLSRRAGLGFLSRVSSDTPRLRG